MDAKKIKPLWVVVILVILGTYPSLYAQDIQFTAQTKKVVRIGETFQLVYSINASGTGFQGPKIQNFQILSGPGPGKSSVVQFANGQTFIAQITSNTYLLQAIKEGDFEIPPAKISVNGKQYTSNAISVKVLKNSTGQQSLYTPDDIVLKAYISNANPVQGEVIVVTYELFFRIKIGDFSSGPSFPGFWVKNFDDKRGVKVQRKVLNGKTYNAADVYKALLIPLKSGPIVIEPWKTSLPAEVKSKRAVMGDPFFDDFFNSVRTEVINVELSSNALSVNVKPLPSDNKPGDFNGAVGAFTFQTDLDKTRAKTNDAINLKVSVKGRGNLELIDKPEINFPPDFEVYDPKVVSNIQVSESGMSGSQVFEYLIIPRKAGSFSMKPISFSYFDLDKKRYVTLTSDAYIIEVEKGAGDNGSSVTTYSGANKEEIKYIGSDIRHIHEGEIDLKPAGSVFFGSFLFWALCLLPLVFLVVFTMIWRKFAVRRSNDVLMKNLRATRIAKKRLNRAEQYHKAGKQDDFYVEISQAVWGYLSDKFSIPLAELSKDSVQGALLGKNVDDALINRFIELLQNTEFARFAPGEKSDNMERIYQEALEAISKMERELR